MSDPDVAPGPADDLGFFVTVRPGQAADASPAEPPPTQRVGELLPDEAADGTQGPKGTDPEEGQPKEIIVPILPRQQPPSYGYGVLALLAGGGAAVCGILLPYALLLVVVLAGLGVGLAWAAVRRTIDTGAAGGRLGAVGGVLALVGLVAMGVGLTETREDARRSITGFSGAFADLEAIEVAAEIRSLALPGRGQATIDLGGVDLEVELDECGLRDPAAGMQLAASGTSDAAGRTVDLALSRSVIGEPVDTVVIGVGADTYALRGQNLFAVEDGRVSVRGPFSELGGGSAVQGSVTATCDA